MQKWFVPEERPVPKQKSQIQMEYVPEYYSTKVEFMHSKLYHANKAEINSLVCHSHRPCQRSQFLPAQFLPRQHRRY
jgi:hypothetical protein